MNVKSARNIKEFVQVLKSDSNGRPYLFLVPGHQGRRYQVELERNGGLRAHCRCMTGIPPGQYCKDNFYTVCYHIRAVCLVAAETQGKVLSWCDNEADAERLARVGGEVFSVRSAQSGVSAWGVVRETEPEPKLAAAGLSKDELVKLAIKTAGSKQQWFSGETLWLAKDAYLANDGGLVRLYQTHVNPKYPEYPQSKSLATIFWLDPHEGGWRRFTVAKAVAELFEA